MSRLSKRQNQAHNEAIRLLAQKRLGDDEREFVLENWQESANHVNSAAGAFFTPSGLCRDTAIYCGDAETISNRKAQVTCVELNPDYVAVGRKLFPEANWICASVEQATGHYDCAISNPPFGKTAKIKGPRYSGEDDLAVVDIAANLAAWGVFILPNMSVPFEYSGRQCYRERLSAKSDRFQSATGIILRCESTDAAYYSKDWRGVSPSVEVCSVSFDEWRAVRQRAEMPLFEAAA
jgi:hypothetical protein